MYRVVERAGRVLGASCAFWAFGRAIGAASASGAAARVSRNEQVVGSIPTGGSQVVRSFRKPCRSVLSLSWNGSVNGSIAQNAQIAHSETICPSLSVIEAARLATQRPQLECATLTHTYGSICALAWRPSRPVGRRRTGMYGPTRSDGQLSSTGNCWRARNGGRRPVRLVKAARVPVAAERQRIATFRRHGLGPGPSRPGSARLDG